MWLGARSNASLVNGPGSNHDRWNKLFNKAGLKYVVYTWLHFPPLWLREQQKENRTLMRCLEHGQETYYLSIFDPRTIQWYDHFYKNLHDHFGDRIDDVYACILGPYGEGNYPLKTSLLGSIWAIAMRLLVRRSICHQGFPGRHEATVFLRWPNLITLGASIINRLTRFIRRRSFQMRSSNPLRKHSSHPRAKRRWLAFITWYHPSHSLISRNNRSKNRAEIFPADKVRMKPGGNAGGRQPNFLGHLLPRLRQDGSAVIRSLFSQPIVRAPCSVTSGWAPPINSMAVKECTEPASSLDTKGFCPSNVLRCFLRRGPNFFTL